MRAPGPQAGNIRGAVRRPATSAPRRYFRHMKTLLLSICLLLLTAQSLRAQAAPPEIVIVRIIEYTGTVDVVITRGPGKSEYLEFSSGPFKKQMITASEKYYDFLHKLYQEGFVLQSTFTPNTDSNSSTTTLVLSKTPRP